MNGEQEPKKKTIYTVIEREGHNDIWVKIGAGHVNRDGSITVKLDALPISGSLHIRDADLSAQIDADNKKKEGL